MQKFRTALALNLSQKNLEPLIKEYRYLRLTKLALGVTEQVHFIITVSCDGLIINTKAETIAATAELYNSDDPDCLGIEFCGIREIE